MKKECILATYEESRSFNDQEEENLKYCKNNCLVRYIQTLKVNIIFILLYVSLSIYLCGLLDCTILDRCLCLEIEVRTIILKLNVF